MTPLEITLLILVLTIVAFITGKNSVFRDFSRNYAIAHHDRSDGTCGRHSVDLSTQMWSCLWQCLSLEQDLRKQV